MGDYVIYAVVIGVFGFMIGTVAVAMFSKNNKGQWDDRSRLRGDMRAKRWGVQDTVANLKDFLLGENTDVAHWPVAKTVGGLMGVTADSGRYHWRSGTTIRPGDGAHILMSVELPQLPDGAEGAMDEVLVRREADGYWSTEWSVPGLGTGGPDSVGPVPQSAVISVDGVATDERPAILTDALLGYIVNWRHVESVHFFGERVTVELGTARSLDNTVEVLEETEAEMSRLIDLLPRVAWSA